MGHTLLAAIAAVALAVAALALAARYVPGVIRPVLVTAALAPYLAFGAPAAMILFAILHNRWRHPGRCIDSREYHGRLPWYVGGKTEGGVGVRIISADLRYGRADAAAVVRLAHRHADIIAVQELTPEEAHEISAAGIDKILPYRVLRAREGPAGIGLWSRYPMEPGTEYDEVWLGLITARVRIPGMPAEATVATTHMSAPWPEPI
jgi:hypothetical protein